MAIVLNGFCSNHLRKVAAGAEIRYDPKSIVRFTGQHIALLEEINKVTKFLGEKDYAISVEILRELEVKLQQHLMEEKLQLHSILTHCLINNIERRTLLNDMPIEMAEIGQQLMRFIKHYLEFGIDDSNAEMCNSELTVIMHALLTELIAKKNPRSSTMGR